MEWRRFVTYLSNDPRIITQLQMWTTFGDRWCKILLQDGCPSCHSTNTVNQSTEGKTHTHTMWLKKRRAMKLFCANSPVLLLPGPWSRVATPGMDTWPATWLSVEDWSCSSSSTLCVSPTSSHLVSTSCSER